MEKISPRTRKKIYSIILAAGEGKRYKGIKFLHNIKGKNMLQVVLDLVLSLNFTQNIMVVNDNWENIKNNFKIPENVIIIKNKNYKEGISSSLKAAIKYILSLNVIPDYVAVFLADMPFILKKRRFKNLRIHR